MGGAVGRLGRLPCPAGLGMRSRRRSRHGWWPRAPPWKPSGGHWMPSSWVGALPIVTAWSVCGTAGRGCAAARVVVLGRRQILLCRCCDRPCPGAAKSFEEVNDAVLGAGGTLSVLLRCALPAGLACGQGLGVAVVPGGGPWILRLADPRARVEVPLSVWGGCQRSRAPAARPFAGWRSSSPLLSGGAGTKGTGAVRGRTRRPISPAAACGRDRQSRGRSWPWLRYPARARGLGVDDLVSDDSGALWSPWWLGRGGCHLVRVARRCSSRVPASLPERCW